MPVPILVHEALAVPIKEERLLIVSHVCVVDNGWEWWTRSAVHDIESEVREETQKDISLFELENVASFLLFEILFEPFSKEHLPTKVDFCVDFRKCIIKKLSGLLSFKSLFVILELQMIVAFIILVSLLVSFFSVFNLALKRYTTLQIDRCAEALAVSLF